MTSSLPSRYITDIQNTLSQSTISKNDLTAIMSNTRQEIERTNTKEDYRILFLICNWCLHPTIDRKEGAEIIQELAALFLPLWDSRSKSTSPTHIDHANMVKEAILLPLKFEFILFFSLNKLTIAYFIDPALWSQFLEMLIIILCDKPLSFPPLSKQSKPQKEIYNSILQNAAGTSWALVGFKFYKDKNNVLSIQFYINPNSSGRYATIIMPMSKAMFF